MIARKLIATIAAASSLALTAPAAAQTVKDANPRNLGLENYDPDRSDGNADTPKTATPQDANPNKPGDQDYGGGPGNYSGVPDVPDGGARAVRQVVRSDGSIRWEQLGRNACIGMARGTLDAEQVAVFSTALLAERSTRYNRKAYAKAFTRGTKSECTLEQAERLQHALERLGGMR